MTAARADRVPVNVWPQQGILVLGPHWQALPSWAVSWLWLGLGLSPGQGLCVQSTIEGGGWPRGLGRGGSQGGHLPSSVDATQGCLRGRNLHTVLFHL